MFTGGLKMCKDLHKRNIYICFSKYGICKITVYSKIFEENFICRNLSKDKIKLQSKSNNKSKLQETSLTYEFSTGVTVCV